MTRHRFTIAQLMALILYVGLAFAALRNADAFWASTTFTVAAIIVSAATVGAFAHKGTSRLIWAGFAGYGWTCALIEWSTFNAYGRMGATPPMLVVWGFRSLQPHIRQTASAGAAFIHYYQVSISLEIILFGLVGAVVGRLVAPRDDLPNP